jgi:uncharacterized protein YyaL (SSP411 family)
MAAIEYSETFNGAATAPDDELVGKIIGAIVAQFDPRYGGFGSQPKFPHSAALDLLLDEAGHDGAGAADARRAAMVTLHKMSNGGIYDHLAGGFHRYSVDERWVVPHFEKMLHDNSELLKNYVHAYQATGEPQCARIVRETMAWIDRTLCDPVQGGFYSSQDADYSFDDDGDYFTWTRTEAAAVLAPDELAVAEPYFDIGPIGDMPHNYEKNVLHIELTMPEAAKAAGVSAESAMALIRSARAKMLAARELRPTPTIDRTVYVNWNAMMISAYLLAGRVLRDAVATQFAVKSLDRLLTSAWDGSHLGHVIGYALEAPAGHDVSGMLEDYVCTGHAVLDAWESTGEYRYFATALSLTDAAVTKFYDHAAGGFFDTEMPASGVVPLGALAARRKPLQDAPSPAGNSVAAHLLVRMAELTGRNDLRAKAQATFECFAALVEHFGLSAASYGLGLRRMVLPSVQVVVVGADELADQLERVALQGYCVSKSVVRLRTPGQLPPSLAEMIPLLPKQVDSFAVVCRDSACQLPISDPAQLAALI